MELRISINEVDRIMLSSSLSLQSDEAHERLLVEVGCDILGGRGESHHVDEVVDETDAGKGQLVLRQYVHAMKSLRSRISISLI